MTHPGGIPILSLGGVLYSGQRNDGIYRSSVHVSLTNCGTAYEVKSMRQDLVNLDEQRDRHGPSRACQAVDFQACRRSAADSGDHDGALAGARRPHPGRFPGSPGRSNRRGPEWRLSCHTIDLPGATTPGQGANPRVILRPADWRPLDSVWSG